TTGTLIIKGTANFGTQTSIGGTVDYAKASPSQAVATIDYNNLTLSGGAGAAKTFPDANVNVGGNLTMAGGVVKADVTLRAGTSAKITYNGSGSQSVAQLDYHDIELATSGTKTFAAGTTKMDGTFTMSGSAAADATTNSTTIQYDGTGSQGIGQINYHNLTVDTRAAGTVTLAGTIGVRGAFSPATFTGSGVYSATGTLDYNGTNATGTGAQTIAAFSYNNLTVSGARVGDVITLASSGTIGVAGTFNPSATFTTGSYTVTGSTIAYNGSGAQSVVGGTTFALYNNLSLSGAAAKTASGDISLTAAGVLTNGVGTSFDMGTNSLAFTAAPTNNGTVLFAGAANGRAVGSAAGTVEYNGTIAQTVTAETYYNLVFANPSGTNAKTVAGATTANNVTLNSASFLSVSGALQINADLTNAGSLTNTGTITVGS
ncbi:MAG: hypothetical protein WBD36_05550, partial [Bacteroidota bacterium]